MGKENAFEVPMAELTSRRETSWSRKPHLFRDVTHVALRIFIYKNHGNPESMKTERTTLPGMLIRWGKEQWNEGKGVCSEMSLWWQWSFSQEDRKDVLLMEQRMKQFPWNFSKEMDSLKQSLLHHRKKGTRILQTRNKKNQRWHGMIASQILFLWTFSPKLFFSYNLALSDSPAGNWFYYSRSYDDINFSGGDLFEIAHWREILNN